MKKPTRDEALSVGKKLLPAMIDSAKRPLDGAQWWMTAEKPFQTLAACIEISNALDSGNTETYESGVPVYQFGFKKIIFGF